MKDLPIGNNDAYVLIHQLQGSAVLTIVGHTVQLEAGDMVVLDAAKPSDFSFLSAPHQVSICLPREIVEKTYPTRPGIVGRKMSGNTHFGSVVGSFVNELSTLLNSPKNEVDAMHRALLALLKPLLST